MSLTRLFGLLLVCYAIHWCKAFCEERSAPAKPTFGVTIDLLIKQLANDDCAERDAASEALQGIGEPAMEALRKTASSSKDPEVRCRASDVLMAVSAVSCAVFWVTRVSVLVSPSAPTGATLQRLERTHLFIFGMPKPEGSRIYARAIWRLYVLLHLVLMASVSHRARVMAL